MDVCLLVWLVCFLFGWLGCLVGLLVWLVCLFGWLAGLVVGSLCLLFGLLELLFMLSF